MRIYHFIIASIALSASLLAAPTQCGGIYYGNEAPDILNAKLVPKTAELCYSAFAVMHSGISRTPLWSAEHLTREGLRSRTARTNDFHPEERLNPDERSELSDYARSGYDRGHMSPSADMPTSQAQHECFTLANMVPQNHANNTGIWSAIESATRHLTNVKGELYVITGPLFTGTGLQRIGKKVLVPTKIYKAIYDPSSGEGAAYVTDNAPGSDYQVLSIAQIEQLAGIRLFPAMAPSAKQTAMDLPSPRERNKNHTEHNDSLIRFLEKLFTGRW